MGKKLNLLFSNWITSCSSLTHHTFVVFFLVLSSSGCCLGLPGLSNSAKLLVVLLLSPLPTNHFGEVQSFYMSTPCGFFFLFSSSTEQIWDRVCRSDFWLETGEGGKENRKDRAWLGRKSHFFFSRCRAVYVLSTKKFFFELVDERKKKRKLVEKLVESGLFCASVFTPGEKSFSFFSDAMTNGTVF